jgi:hypothetical protein
MIRRPDDTSRELPGGRAEQRRRMFENARRPQAKSAVQPKKKGSAVKKSNKGGATDEKQD